MAVQDVARFSMFPSSGPVSPNQVFHHEFYRFLTNLSSAIPVKCCGTAPNARQARISLTVRLFIFHCVKLLFPVKSTQYGYHAEVAVHSKSSSR
jgi:hypothetical protein